MHTYSLQLMTPTLSPTPPIRVAVAGATGYAGQELVRLLARHPGIRFTSAMSSGGERRRLPALTRIWDGEVQKLDVEALPGTTDVVFLALPEAAAAGVGATLVEQGIRVIGNCGRQRGVREGWLRGDIRR